MDLEAEFRACGHKFKHLADMFADEDDTGSLRDDASSTNDDTGSKDVGFVCPGEVEV